MNSINRANTKKRIIRKDQSVRTKYKIKFGWPFFVFYKIFVNGITVTV